MKKAFDFTKLPFNARIVIEEIFESGSVTKKTALAAFKNNEFLASINATEKDFEEARSYIDAIPVDSDTELSFYSVRGAIRSGEAFCYNDESLEQQLLDCYEDIFELGLFANDEDAIAAAENRQRVDDMKAQAILEAARSECALEGGPVYIDHIEKYVADGIERVE